MSGPVLLTVHDVQRLAQACSRRAATGIRNRALIIVLHCGALRISEALALSQSSIDCVERRITVDGRAPRVVRINRSAAEEIERWMRVRAQRGLNCDPLFCTLAGEPIEQAYVRQMLPEVARKAGINKPVNASALRDALAATLLPEEMTHKLLRELRYFLGFQSTASTVRYLKRVMSIPRQPIM